MIRVALESVLVFLLPSILYFGYVMVKDAAAGGVVRSLADHIEAAPLGWLFAIGCVCLAATLFTFATLEDDSIDKPYAPAIFKDGKIQQGH